MFYMANIQNLCFTRVLGIAELLKVKSLLAVLKLIYCDHIRSRSLYLVQAMQNVSVFTALLVMLMYYIVDSVRIILNCS